MLLTKMALIIIFHYLLIPRYSAIPASFMIINKSNAQNALLVYLIVKLVQREKFAQNVLIAN